MEQNTKDWLAWRREGIGSSDAPVVLGVSPYKTRFQLWEDKTGRSKDVVKNNFILEKGHRLEPVARAKYELAHDIDMPTVLCQHSEYEFLRASMDGFNDDVKKGLEIKFVGKDDWLLATEKNQVPEKYYPQLQHQILVSGARSIDYLSFHLKKIDGVEVPPSQGEVHVIEVFPDIDFLEKYIVEVKLFWDMVQTDTPPEKCDKDTHNFTGSDSNDLALAYIEAEAILKNAEKNLKKIKEKIIEKAQAYHLSSFLGGQLKATKVYRKGSVDYAAVPELKNIDLDQYRKPQTFSFMLKVKK